MENGESTIADEFPEVTVYFLDITGFTLLTEQVGHKEIVRILNEISAIMNEKLDQFDIEKIKRWAMPTWHLGSLRFESSMGD